MGAARAGASTTRSTSTAQIDHGLEEAEYGYWGFSPSNNPDGGYREYGVDPIGLEPNGYASDQERTFVDYGFERLPAGRAAAGRLRPRRRDAARLVPRARLRPRGGAREPRQAARGLRRYGAGGFYDAIDVVTGKVSRYYLALDQGMIMAAIANELDGRRVPGVLRAGEVEAAVRPVIGMEEFTAGG